MSHDTQHSKPSENEPMQSTSTDSQSKETPSNEMGWLVSGLLILVLGFGGVLMFSQEEDLRVESSKPVASDQLSQAFPSPAIASPSDPTVLPVSMAQGITPPDEETTLNKIEEKVIYFEFDQAVLSDEAKTLLAPQDQLTMDENKTILVRGHTDQKGSEAYNQNLSIRRAKAVKEYLVSLGHAADSIHVEGFGKAQPACTESTDTCAAQNRRANLFFSKPDSTVADSELLVSQTLSESDKAPIASPEAPREGTESDSDTKIETVQLTESAEEILPTDPVASITPSQ
ncbi:MAG: OmpA family protein [Nitrospirota bacterium]|nr:MAG: OmpA family protein [Nitrospirota bacterium]